MMKRILLVLVCVSMVSMTQAALLSYSSTAPGVGSAGTYFLGESATDEANVEGGDDAASYFAHDRLNTGVGQSFTTGSEEVTMYGMWFKNVQYDAPSGNGTWWYINNEDGSEGGAQLRYRLSEVSGTDLTVISNSTYTVTGTELNNDLMPVNWDADKVGTGTWVYFGLDAPVTLAANTTYAFDVATIASSPMYFMEIAGVNDDSYAGGSAYQADDSAAILQTWTGDHTFVVETVPEPMTLVLLGLGSVLLRRKR